MLTRGFRPTPKDEGGDGRVGGANPEMSGLDL